MKQTIAAVFAVVILLVANSLVFAKGVTTRVRISGATLAAPVELTGPAILQSFTVWDGPGTFVNDVEATQGFIVDWASGVVTEPETRGESFEVSFYTVDVNGAASRPDEHLAYVVRFRMTADGRGYVYLPGPADPFYGMNVASILRGGEGKWFHSTHEWEQVVRQRIEVAPHGARN
jgi:hypothetical protein